MTLIIFYYMQTNIFETVIDYLVVGGSINEYLLKNALEIIFCNCMYHLHKLLFKRKYNYN